MKFCTAINCMDGRIQLPVIKYLQKRFNAEFVDDITEAGPNLLLAEKGDTVLVDSVLERVKISVEVHKSNQIAIVGHHDCAKNPAPKEIQIIHTQKAIEFVKLHFSLDEVIGLWVDENWEVSEIL